MFTILLQGKQQNTTLRQDNQQETCPRRSVVHSCFPCSNPWFAWASKRRYPGEALLLVVKVVRVVFPCIHVRRQETCRRRSVVFCCFPTSSSLSAWASKRRYPGEALLLVVKVVQVVFLCVHVDSAGKRPSEALLLVVKVVRIVFLCVHVRRQETCPARGLEGKGGTFCCNNLL